MHDLLYAALGIVVRALIGAAVLLSAPQAANTHTATQAPCQQPPESGAWRALTPDTRIARIEIRARCAPAEQKPSFIPQPDWSVTVVGRCGAELCAWGSQPALRVRSAPLFVTYRRGLATHTIYGQLATAQPAQIHLTLYTHFADPALLDTTEELSFVRE